MTDISKNTTDLLTGSVAQDKLVPLMNGAGLVPIGGIISIMPYIVGVNNISATTVAGLDGWVRCNGQTISDPTSPLNSKVIPNLNNSVFLEGHTTSGTSGGANSYSLTTAQLKSHNHGMSHTHNIGHGHGFTPDSSQAAGVNHRHSGSAHSHDSGDLAARIKLHGGSASNAIISQIVSSGAWTFNDSTGFNVPPANQPGAGTFGGVAVAGDTGLGGGGTTGYSDEDVNLSGTVDGYAGTVSISNTTKSQSTGSSSAINNRPSYITTVYLIRIK